MLNTFSMSQCRPLAWQVQMLHLDAWRVRSCLKWGDSSDVATRTWVNMPTSELSPHFKQNRTCQASRCGICTCQASGLHWDIEHVFNRMSMRKSWSPKKSCKFESIFPLQKIGFDTAENEPSTVWYMRLTCYLHSAWIPSIQPRLPVAHSEPPVATC